MSNESVIQELASRYGPMLDELQQALGPHLGAVLWDHRTEPAEVALRGGARALRVGAIHAIGVPTAQLDPVALTDTTNEVLGRWGFPPQPPMTGSPSGNLIYEASDSHGGRFTMLIKMAIDAWVDAAVPEPAR